jgi:putative membrane protein
VHVDDFSTALIFAIILSVLNAIVRPLLILLTIPLTFMTLGLFLLVINALIVLMADGLIDGFYTDGFWWALLFSVLLSIVNAVLNDIAGQNKKPR